MKAGILYSDRDIRPGDAPDPQVGPHEVLVETSHTGIFGTDLHIYRGEFRARVTYPTIIGHEFGGIIREVGKEVKGLLAKGLLHPELLITHQMPLRHITAAFDKVDQADPGTLKVVLNVQEA